MFTNDAIHAISSVFSWIWAFINITIPGLTVTLWQLAIGLLMFRIVWRIALGLANTVTGAMTYRTTSYNKETTTTTDTYKYVDKNITDPDYAYSVKQVRRKE